MRVRSVKKLLVVAVLLMAVMTTGCFNKHKEAVSKETTTTESKENKTKKETTKSGETKKEKESQKNETQKETVESSSDLMTITDEEGHVEVIVTDEIKTEEKKPSEEKTPSPSGETVKESDAPSAEADEGEYELPIILNE